MGEIAVIPHGGFNLFGRWFMRLAILLSAIFLALIVSGAIFFVIPGITIAHTHGISMVPTFRSGDVVVIRIKHPSKVHVGEIVLFPEDVPVTHRVISVGPDLGPRTVITTKGDNNAVEDKSIQLQSIQGEVIGKLPFLGEVSRWLGAGGGFYVYHYIALMLDLFFILIVATMGVLKFNRESKQSLSS